MPEESYNRTRARASLEAGGRINPVLQEGDRYDTLVRSLQNATAEEERDYYFRADSPAFDRLNGLIDTANRRYALRRQRMAQDIHRYVKAHGIPNEWPEEWLACLYGPIGVDATLDSKNEVASLPFYYFGDDFPRLERSSGFNGVEQDDTLWLKTGLKYRSFYDNGGKAYFDSEYRQLEERRRLLESKLAADDIRRAESGEEDESAAAKPEQPDIPYERPERKNLRSRATIAVGAGLLTMLVLYGLLGVLNLNISLTYVGIAVAFLISVVVIYQMGVRLRLFSALGVEHAYRRREAAEKKDREGKSAYERRRDELRDLIASDAYRRAKERDAILRRKDTELAEQWQTAWYNWCLSHKDKYIL